jgi:hypothetical protein
LSARTPVVGFLFALRGLPDRVMALLGKRPTAPAAEAMRLGDLPVEGEWIRLAEDPGHEIVFGAVGRFWKGPIQWQQSEAEQADAVQAASTTEVDVLDHRVGAQLGLLQSTLETTVVSLGELAGDGRGAP